MAGMYFAHSGSDPGRSEWQLLRDHLTEVGRLASQSADVFGCADAGRLAGLLHDLGKYTPAFQARLGGANLRVDHSTAGAACVLAAAQGRDRIIAELLAYAIAGHHAGLPDMLGHSGSSLSERLKGYSDGLDPIWKNEISPDCRNLWPKLSIGKGAQAAFQLSILGRMLFSCLVDADYRDTERFYSATNGLPADRDWVPLRELLEQFTSKLDARILELSDRPGSLNTQRMEILGHVRSRAVLAPGLFTLTVPTGGGKTLASLAFALDHARLHGHRRIIYAIPFTSIIDQTAAIFRSILGDEHVLEHHSAIEIEGQHKSMEQRNKLKLAMEDWAAPVVVTTNVQFFESLFAARPSRARKIHNIAGSVIILDEAQTLPRRLLLPCVQMLSELSLNYHCSIVLCTATQPALDERNFTPGHKAGLKLEGRELAPNPPELARRLRRASLRFEGQLTDTDLVAALEREKQGLIIVNSRKHALALYTAAKGAGLEGVIHLSTRQYPAHRQEILEVVRQRLRSGAACRVIATSLVEAGVDIDFPRVWRAEAGMDQIAQAAGRCNREGNRRVEDSIVTVFAAPDFPAPPEIRALSGDMLRVIERHRDDLLSPHAMTDYFGEVYWRIGEDGLDAAGILDKFAIGPKSTNFAYRSAASDFRMIESGMEPVIIPLHPLAARAVEELAVESIGSGRLARDLQRFIVQVPPDARARLISHGHVAFRSPELRGDQFALLLNPSLYSNATGLLWEEAEYLSSEQTHI